MGQVRWAGWAMAIVAALVLSGTQVVRADVASDKPAAILIYPKVVVNSTAGIDTMIRLTNTSPAVQDVHCFYIDANSHCSGSLIPSLEGTVCTDATTCGGGACIPAWLETDFHIRLTQNQPFEWRASDADVTVFDPSETTLDIANLPIPTGVCLGNTTMTCGTDSDCTNRGVSGPCLSSNASTAIPPVSEDPFVGELKCIAVDASGVPAPNNVLKGEALIETASLTNLDVASYNAIGVQSTGAQVTDNVLTLGGDNADYNGCPGVLILNHFFDGANDPVPGAPASVITTDLTLVPCSEDLLRQIPGSAVAQYLVFNEFEQRFSASNTVRCFLEEQICQLSGGQCNRSIFSVATAGTLTGQTRITPIGTGLLPSGLLGVAIERHGATDTTGLAVPGSGRTAAFNLHFQGSLTNPDTITIP